MGPTTTRHGVISGGPLRAVREHCLTLVCTTGQTTSESDTGTSQKLHHIPHMCKHQARGLVRVNASLTNTRSPLPRSRRCPELRTPGIQEKRELHQKRRLSARRNGPYTVDTSGHQETCGHLSDGRLSVTCGLKHYLRSATSKTALTKLVTSDFRGPEQRLTSRGRRKLLPPCRRCTPEM